MVLRQYTKQKFNPVYFLGFDTEDKGNHDPYLFSLYGEIKLRKSKKVQHIDITTSDINEILEILNKQVIDTYLIGFNLSYDLNNIFPQYDRPQRYWKGKFAGFEKNENKIKGIEMAGKWFQRIDLKGLAEKFGVEYIDEHTPESPNIKNANRSHAKAIYEITKQLEETFNELGYTMGYARNYMPTASSMAFHVWKDIEHQNPETWDKSLNILAGAAYHGGWCDLFITVANLAQHYDYVSMYPSVMKDHDYPNPNVPFKRGETNKLKEYLKDKAGFAIGIITTPKILISPFAYKSSHKLMFPIGQWRTTITFPEIEYLYELGGSFECESVYYTDRWQPFNRYVDKFYALKTQKKYKEVAKLFLNGLSGKFGQKVRPEGEYIEIEQEEIDNSPTNEAGLKTFYVFDKIYEYLKPGKAEIEYSYYPLVSAYITAYSRIRLHRTMCTVGYENVAYVDTDSIVSLNPVPDELITKDKTLGMLEHEGKDVKFYGIAPKKYKEFKNGKWEFKANGIPKKMQEQFWKNPYAPIEYEQPLSFKQALRRHKMPNQWVKVVKIHTPEQKRFFNPDGTSRPFEIYEKN